MDNWISVPEAAELLGIETRQVRNLIGSEIDAERIGRVWLVSRESVESHSRQLTEVGRPLAPESAWQILSCVDTALRGGGAPVDAPSDRRDRHRLRRRMSSLPDVERWSSWMRRRADRRRVWFHPGIWDRLCSDERIEHPDLSALLRTGFAPTSAVYVDERLFDAVLSEFHGRLLTGLDVAGATDMRVVPTLGRIDWRSHAGASAVVDASVHADARVRHGALEVLRDAAGRLSADLAAEPSERTKGRR